MVFLQFELKLTLMAQNFSAFWLIDAAEPTVVDSDVEASELLPSLSAFESVGAPLVFPGSILVAPAAQAPTEVQRTIATSD